MKKLVCVFLCVLTVFLTGCYDFVYKYDGNRWDLFTVASNSLLGVVGTVYKQREGPHLEILEEDEYGRTLFYYCEKAEISTHSLLIAQKTEGDYVYFYPYINFIDSEMNCFSDDEIMQLKNQNDWGLAIDETKMQRVKIVYSCPGINSQRKEIFDDIREYESIEEDVYQYHIPCQVDDYGRELLLFKGLYGDKILWSEYYVVIVGIDKTYSRKSIMKLEKMTGYQEELKQFKEANNWNQPV